MYKLPSQMGRTNLNWPLDMKDVDCYLVPKRVLTQTINGVNFKKYIKVQKIINLNFRYPKMHTKPYDKSESYYIKIIY